MARSSCYQRDRGEGSSFSLANQLAGLLRSYIEPWLCLDIGSCHRKSQIEQESGIVVLNTGLLELLPPNLYSVTLCDGAEVAKLCHSRESGNPDTGGNTPACLIFEMKAGFPLSRE
jgi:hypothetical protein